LSYEELLKEAHNEGLIVKEKPLVSRDGLINGKRIAIRMNIPTLAQKACTLAEEIGHHKMTAGDILEQSSVSDQKQEYIARLWSYNRMIGLQGIISGYKANCQNRYELAEFLNVTEEFLQEALDCYCSKYGAFAELDNYVIIFQPNLSVVEKL